ncbi:MAG: YIP1 family protein [Gammaproteobacteria bacterium]|nr:YIP1 family protein [Gammaproteobacteria bacterium]MDH3465107.1 YIP1 family protein [Gammaproteobacteria bacterium]
MLLHHIPGLVTRPQAEWASIRAGQYSVGDCFFSYVFWLAAVPPLAGLLGTTLVGWRIAGGTPVKLTFDSAVQISIVYYVAILVAVFTIGKLIHWMGETYGALQPLGRCVALAAFTATPLFIVGFMQIYPVLWLNFIVGLPALAYTAYLLYTGVPIMMEIPLERGFLFSSSILAVGLVALVGLLAATAVLWGIGLGPSFTN